MTIQDVTNEMLVNMAISLMYATPAVIGVIAREPVIVMGEEPQIFTFTRHQVGEELKRRIQ